MTFDKIKSHFHIVQMRLNLIKCHKFTFVEFMTFDKIKSHFHIVQKYFYKYIQVRHYVSTRNGGLSIRNYDHFLEKCL